jgi:hypothetical protein
MNESLLVLFFRKEQEAALFKKSAQKLPFVIG